LPESRVALTDLEIEMHERPVSALIQGIQAYAPASVNQGLFIFTALLVKLL